MGSSSYSTCSTGKPVSGDQIPGDPQCGPGNKRDTKQFSHRGDPGGIVQYGCRIPVIPKVYIREEGNRFSSHDKHIPEACPGYMEAGKIRKMSDPGVKSIYGSNQVCTIVDTNDSPIVLAFRSHHYTVSSASWLVMTCVSCLVLIGAF